jgi:hypothetical protein
MSITKKSNSGRVSGLSKKNGKQSNVTIIYKSKVPKSSFPEKTEKINKLLSKAKLLK